MFEIRMVFLVRSCIQAYLILEFKILNQWKYIIQQWRYVIQFEMILNARLDYRYRP